MDGITKYLKETGLTSEELTVYFKLLQGQNNTVLTVSKSTNIPRTTVYLIIESLIKRKLVSEIVTEGKKIIMPEPPEKILELVKQKKDQISEAFYDIRDNLPKLSAVFNVNYQKPEISYFEGVEEIFKLILKALNTDKIYIFAPSDKFMPIFGTKLKGFFKELNDSFIYSKELYLKEADTLSRVEAEKSIRNQCLYTPDVFKAPVDTVIFDGFVVMISYKNSVPYALVRQDKDFEVTERMKFVMIWQYLIRQKNT
jgi:sugar-specific transcriptional regulator TrmB